jgi:hypothetical protein
MVREGQKHRLEVVGNDQANATMPLHRTVSNGNWLTQTLDFRVRYFVIRRGNYGKILFCKIIYSEIELSHGSAVAQAYLVRIIHRSYGWPPTLSLCNFETIESTNAKLCTIDYITKILYYDKGCIHTRFHGDVHPFAWNITFACFYNFFWFQDTCKDLTGRHRVWLVLKTMWLYPIMCLLEVKFVWIDVWGQLINADENIYLLHIVLFDLAYSFCNWAV